MSKKQYFLTIDCETTQDQLVADFAAVVSDRKGRIHAQCAVLVRDVYDKPKEHPLFFDPKLPPDALWSRSNQDRRYTRYDKMLSEGSRMIASVSAINRWISQAIGKYDPILTAYNLAFDADKMDNTDIAHAHFSRRFCLWYSAAEKWGHTNSYKQWVLDSHAFNPPTPLGNMTYKTNAEVMARFILQLFSLPDEPHTALEDIIGYELPILNALVKRGSIASIIERGSAYSWHNFQVNNHFQPMTPKKEDD